MIGKVELRSVPRRKPEAYIEDDGDGYYTAYVDGVGFRANVSLPMATAFIRDETLRRTGSVPCFDRQRQEWTSEIDIAESA